MSGNKKSPRHRKPTLKASGLERLSMEAGAEAYQTSGNKAGDPTALRKLLSAKCMDVINGIEVGPLTPLRFVAMETVWALPLYQTAQGTLQQLLTMYAFCRPDEVDALVSAGAKARAIITKWSNQFTVADYKALCVLVARRINEFYGEGDAQKKSLKTLRTGPRQ